MPTEIRDEIVRQLKKKIDILQENWMQEFHSDCDWGKLKIISSQSDGLYDAWNIVNNIA